MSLDKLKEVPITLLEKYETEAGEYVDTLYFCPACHKEVFFARDSNYCPNCGQRVACSRDKDKTPEQVDFTSLLFKAMKNEEWSKFIKLIKFLLCFNKNYSSSTNCTHSCDYKCSGINCSIYYHVNRMEETLSTPHPSYGTLINSSGILYKYWKESY